MTLTIWNKFWTVMNESVVLLADDLNDFHWSFVPRKDTVIELWPSVYVNSAASACKLYFCHALPWKRFLVLLVLMFSKLYNYKLPNNEYLIPIFKLSFFSSFQLIWKTFWCKPHDSVPKLWCIKLFFLEHPAFSYVMCSKLRHSLPMKQANF